MGTVWIKEFTGGLDARRMPETTAGGVLVKAENGHVTRGGEFEKRAAFVPVYELPAGDTVGLSSARAGLYVFGHEPAPVGLPVGVTYQRLQHEDGATALARILSSDLYAGKLYVVGEFADGSIFHFYDGVRVEDWYDGRSSASFEITGGGITPALRAVGSFEITGGTSNPGVNRISSIVIDGVSIIGAAINHTGNNATTAAAVAAAITSHASSPDYTATSDGQTVIVTASATGPAPNGKAIFVAVGGDVTVGNEQVMIGGSDAIASSLTDLKINGVSVISAPVEWSTSHEATAAAIAAAVNTSLSSPEYTATSVGARVNLIAATPGAAPNGFAVTFTLNNLTVDPNEGLVLAGGANVDDTFQPGTFVKTIGKKMYSVSGPNTHFSGISAPTQWTTDAVGAGFIDMSTESSGSEQLVALARYQNFVAVFAERVIQVWFFDPDPALSRQIQVLNNTGTISGLSVTQIGDNDLFYLDESGLRSLKARDSSNAAATTDIGVPVDTLITAKLQTLTATERSNIIGLIEPHDGRFWLIMKDAIFVFSLFNGAKISAWTTYVPSVVEDDETVTFDIDAATVFDKRVYVRSGDTIYVYGGLGTSPTYDATVAEAWLPYLDANDPTRRKEWQGIDAALEGAWDVYYAMNPNNTAAQDKIANLFRTTYDEDRVPSLGGSTHISPRFRTTGDGYARLSSVVVHYEGGDNED